MVHTCVVWGCTNRANSGDKRRQFYDIPKVITHQGAETERLSTQRRNLWLTKINREGFNPDPTKRHYKVCSDHFITGRRAELYDFTNPDWAPSVLMGPELPSSSPAIKSQSAQKRYNRARGGHETKKRYSAAEALLDLHRDTMMDREIGGSETTSDISDDWPGDDAVCDTFDVATPPDMAESVGGENNLMTIMRAELQRLTSENMELREKLKETVRATSALNKFEKLMLVLMKLRLNLSLQDLAYRFKISKSCVSKVFLDVIHVLYVRLKSFILWPEREELQMSMPMEFRKYFGVKVSIIIDCFEVFIERPSNLLARAETWSSYKHHNTVKFLIGITPQGAVSFLSKGWGGRTSDKHVTEHCGLLDKLLPGDIVLAR